MGAGTWALGIDIGTTSVAAAVEDHGRLEVVELGGGHFPPAVFFGRDGRAITGPSAAERAEAEPDRAVLSPKRALAAAGTVSIAGAPVPVSQAYTAILQAVVGEAARGREAAVPGRLVLSYPAWWGHREQAVLSEAAAAASLPVPALVAEPVAAACYLGLRARPGQYVAVLDAGGGSIDSAVLRRTRTGFALKGTPGTVLRPEEGEPSVTLRQGAYELLSTIANAGLTPGQLSAVHVTGEGSRSPGAAEVIAQILGTEPRLAPNPGTATALGALGAPVHAPRGVPAPAGAPGAAALPAVSDAAPGQVPERAAAKSPRPRPGTSRRALLISGFGLGSVAAAAIVVGLLRASRQPAAHPRRIAPRAGSPADSSPAVTVTGVTGGVSAVAFSPDGTTLAAGGDVLRLWDLAGRRATATHTLELGAAQLTSMAFSPDGARLALAVGPIVFCDVRAGTISRADLGVAGGVASVAFSPDGKTVAGGCYDGTVRLWETAGLRPITVLSLGDSVISVAFSPDGKRLAGCCQEQAALWDAGSWRPATRLVPSATTDQFVVFSPDGKTLASGGGSLAGADSCQIELWDVATGRRNAIVPDGTSALTSLVFTRDGRAIIGGGDSLQEWDIPSGKLIAAPPNPPAAPAESLNALPYGIGALALTSDGTTLAAGGNDGTVRLMSVRASGLRT